MSKHFLFSMIVVFTSPSYGWGYVTGKVDNLYVNTYGNYSTNDLNGGFCFKLVGFDYYFKVAYSDSGEKKSNMLFAQSMVLAASLSGRELKVTYIDWGTDPTCRVSGASMPARWLENLQVLN